MHQVSRRSALGKAALQPLRKGVSPTWRHGCTWVSVRGRGRAKRAKNVSSPAVLRDKPFVLSLLFSDSHPRRLDCPWTLFRRCPQEPRGEETQFYSAAVGQKNQLPGSPQVCVSFSGFTVGRFCLFEAGSIDCWFENHTYWPVGRPHKATCSRQQAAREGGDVRFGGGGAAGRVSAALLLTESTMLVWRSTGGGVNQGCNVLAADWFHGSFSCQTGCLSPLDVSGWSPGLSPRWTAAVTRVWCGSTVRPCVSGFHGNTPHDTHHSTRMRTPYLRWTLAALRSTHWDESM